MMKIEVEDLDVSVLVTIPLAAADDRLKLLLSDEILIEFTESIGLTVFEALISVCRDEPE